MNTNKTTGRTIATICMGLALFATQFGAGNLIFPPYLGRDTGSHWFSGFMGFFLMDVGLAAAAILSVVVNREGTVDGVVGKLGRKPGRAMLTLIILCLGPCVCIPRTACTTFEMGIHALIPGLPLWAFGLIFFSIVTLFVIRPAKVVDIIGKFLTPILLAVMVLLIIIGITHPVGEITEVQDVVAFKSGILNGYQTLDGIGGVLMTMMLMTAARNYGYEKKKDITFMVVGADIIAAVLLALVYGGLTLLGATTSGLAAYANLDQAPLLITLTQQLMGRYGMVALAIIVLMACLTTAVGLTSVAGDYFEDMSGGKLKYKTVVLTVLAVSYAMSNFGLSNIISIAVPVLSILYPPLIVLVISALLDGVIKNNLVGGFAAYAALTASVLEVLASFGLPVGFISSLPFAEYGMCWIVPALIGGCIGALMKKPAVIEEAVFNGTQVELD